MTKVTKRIAAVMIALFAVFALSGCMPASTGGIEAGGTEGASPSSGIMTFIPLILIIVVFYFILIRPQNKKNKQTAQMRSAVKRGDHVVTIGGFVGRVVRVKDEVITIEVGSDKTKLDIQRWGISKIEESLPESRSSKVREEKQEEEEQPKRKPKKLTAPKKEPEPEDEEDFDEDEDGEDEDE